MKCCLKMVCLFMSIASYAAVNDSLDYAHVERVKAIQEKSGSWCFHVTVRHNDEGWEHYADAWQVTDDRGVILGERVLFHPHVNEQPFTRSLCGVKVPVTTKYLRVRAKCNQHGFGGKEVDIDLSTASGEDYVIVP